MNLWVHGLQFPIYPCLTRWTARIPPLSRPLAFAAAEIAGAVAGPADERNATHFSIACRKAAAGFRAPVPGG
ncbi:MAG: hypothetical protein IRY94_18675, partial [Rhodospirillaceae bacterium]|nr:hypothetical protein [Rhodospirillaceae bacterium]